MTDNIFVYALAMKVIKVQEKFKIIAQIEDDDGNIETTVESSSEIPSYEDFDKLGFRAAFHEFEGAVLETSRKVNVQVSEHYLLSS
jgi:hypothetical protein